MAASAEHDKLVSMTARWFNRQGFAVVATELASYGNREQPDVYACRQSCSAMAEIKVSRADFFADAKKPERAQGGLGHYRFYVCPEGMIQPGELPQGWGLLYAIGRSVSPVLMPKAIMWPGPKNLDDNWGPFAHDEDGDAARAALFSIARRLAAGKPTYT